MESIHNASQSEKQLLFEKQYWFKKRCILFGRLLLILLFLILWEFCSDKKIIDPFFFSAPSRMLSCFWEMSHTRQLFSHITISLFETIISFLTITILSIMIAAILWRFEICSSLLEPLLILLNSLPKSALAPLIIVWFGTGMKTIILCGISVAIFGCIINLYSAFSNADKEKQKLITLLGGNKKQIFLYVVLPSNVETILSNMKVNIGLSLVGVMIGEFLAAKRGLGYLIIYSSQVFELDLLILCIFILCMIAVILYQSLQLIEKMILHK